MNNLRESVQQEVKQLFDVNEEVILTRPEPKFGDFTSNVALRLAKKLNRNPREVAEEIAEKLRGNKDISKVDVAGPGFINVTLNDGALVKSLDTKIKKSRAGQKIVIETNNPNPFKAMHIGHALNAILADTIANLIEADGVGTHRVSYHGDVGAHVGKSMWSLLKFVGGNAAKLDEIEHEDRNSFMSKMYAEGAKGYDDHKQEIDELAKQSFVLDDPLYKEVYQTCKTWSFEQIDDLVARLGNKPIEKRYLEGEADALGVKTVKDHVGDVFKESDGAIIFEGSKYGAFDNVFVQSNGLGLYGARDLGLIQLKNNDFHASKSYIVTAEEQKDYFRGVIAAAELCLPELKGVTVNISHGTVKLTTGKMSSRDGNVIEIDWLLQQISNAVKEHASEQNPAIEAGALRYQFLKVKIGSDVVFDINEAVSVVGNSGPYLQYAHARARSIMQKSSLTPADLESVEFDILERALAQKISQYTEVVELATGELAPHHICTYLYGIAQVFNRFYEKSKVIGDSREQLRLSLVSRYADTLQSGLNLLGIEAPDRI